MTPLVFHPIYSQLNLPARHRFPIEKIALKTIHLKVSRSFYELFKVLKNVLSELKKYSGLVTSRHLYTRHVTEPAAKPLLRSLVPLQQVEHFQSQNWVKSMQHYQINTS